MSWFDEISGGLGQWWDDNAETVGEFVGGFVGSTGDNSKAASPDQDKLIAANLHGGVSGSQPVISAPVSQTQTGNQLIQGVDNSVVYIVGGLIVAVVAVVAIKK